MSTISTVGAHHRVGRSSPRSAGKGGANDAAPADEVSITKFESPDLETRVTAQELAVTGEHSAGHAAGAATGGWISAAFSWVKGFVGGIFGGLFGGSDAKAKASAAAIKKNPQAASSNDVRAVVEVQYQAALAALDGMHGELSTDELKGHKASLQRYFRLLMEDSGSALKEQRTHIGIIQHQLNGLEDKKTTLECYVEQLLKENRIEEAAPVARRIENLDATIGTLSKLQDKGNELYAWGDKRRKGVVNKATLEFEKVEAKRVEAEAKTAYADAAEKAAGVGTGFDGFGEAVGKLSEQYDYKSASSDARTEHAMNRTSESEYNAWAVESEAEQARGMAALKKIAGRMGYTLPEDAAVSKPSPGPEYFVAMTPTEGAASTETAPQ
ncbi:MAG: hypothetical protein HY319_15910 [Armatimonadetes bacterium]|nr:hypothetical protein [Armatimonadota bacterium]